MKTNTHFFTDYTIQPLKQLCTELFSSLWLSPQERSLLRVIIAREKQTKKSSSKKKPNRISKILRVLVDRVAAVQNSKSVAKAFPRFVVGLVMLVWLAPYADNFYTKLDFNDRVSPDVWYYESYHWLFLCLGPYLKNIITVVGLYLIFVHKHSFIKTVAASYALMYDIGKIIWLLLVQNHDEYKTLTPKMFMIYGFITSAFLIYMIELLSYWLHHRVKAIKARFEGLRVIAYHVPAEKFRDSVVETMDNDIKVQNFQQY